MINLESICESSCHCPPFHFLLATHPPLTSQVDVLIIVRSRDGDFEHVGPKLKVNDRIMFTELH